MSPFHDRYGREPTDLQPALASRRRPHLWRSLAGVGFVALTAAALLGLAREHRGFFLVNTTPSEPPGIYVRAADTPIRVGSLVAFMAPPPAFPYADRHAGYLRKTPVIKAVAAVDGDLVCTEGGALTINGARRAPIRRRDGDGQMLPHWAACRRLATGELFAFSGRVPNSFDSRYFGPVDAARAEVYRPLITVDGVGR